MAAQKWAKEFMIFSRRHLLALLPGAALGGLTTTPTGLQSAMEQPAIDKPASPEGVTLFLSGDVMLGRGIDQILPHPGDPRLHEPSLSSAKDYLELAETAHGPIPRPVDFSYVWGDALVELKRIRPHVRIINLETSITKSTQYAPKGINYKMNPDNIGCLTAMNVDCCVLANNHVLDWARSGLLETLDTLQRAHIASAGAGRNATQASAPVTLDVAGRGRVLVFAFGSVTSGIPITWSAGDDKPGINLLDDLSDRAIDRIAAEAKAVRRRGDILIASIHWGDNWGYSIPDEQRRFAHGLIDVAGFDIIHGHSAHHAKAIEVYREKLILYGCGDFLNDYEGIEGYEAFRDDLVVGYVATCSASSGKLVELRLIPFQIKKFRLTRASRTDAAWLRDTLDRECAQFDTRIALGEDESLTAGWK